MTVQRANVPCGSCRLCCMNDLLVLHPECGDVITDYDSEVRRNPLTGKLVHALKHKPNGECVYLGPDGCTIHDRAPAICREFDCRRLYLSMTRAERRRLTRAGLMDQKIFDAGRERLASLEESEHGDQRQRAAGAGTDAAAAADTGAVGTAPAAAADAGSR